MKASELMIADIVRYKGNAYKVCGILGYADVTQLHPLRKRDAEGKYLLPINTHDDIEPIPLTEEVLKANGIPTNGDTNFFDSDINYYLELQWEDCKLWWTINLAEYSIMPFTYVHELQHAMRLCGLNELADNFKI